MSAAEIAERQAIAMLVVPQFVRHDLDNSTNGSRHDGKLASCPACLLAGRPAGLLSCQPACLLTYLLASMLASL